MPIFFQKSCFAKIFDCASFVLKCRQFQSLFLFCFGQCFGLPLNIKSTAADSFFKPTRRIFAFTRALCLGETLGLPWTLCANFVSVLYPSTAFVLIFLHINSYPSAITPCHVLINKIFAHAYWLKNCKLWLNEKKNEAEISTRARSSFRKPE